MVDCIVHATPSTASYTLFGLLYNDASCNAIVFMHIAGMGFHDCWLCPFCRY